MKTRKSELESILNRNIYEKLNSHSYEIESLNSIELLTPNRFDVIAKIVFAKFYLNNYDSNFGEDMYISSIKVINGLIENDESGKIGSKSFISSFKTLLNSINMHGFSDQAAIPLSKEGSIIDGAHRLAALIYLRKKIQVVKTEIASFNFDYIFFKNRGFRLDYLDYMALEYLMIKKKNIFAVFIWPSAGDKKNEGLNNILSIHGKVVYSKELHLTQNGKKNIIIELYKNEPWLGNFKNNFIGAENKANWCFQNDIPVKFFLYECPGEILKIKDEIRELYGIGKHAVHITDNYEESIDICEKILNKNGLDWINYRNNKEFSWTNKLIDHYKLWINETNLKKELFCVDGSVSLSVHGIREARDLDYFYSGPENIESGFKEIGNHNEHSIFYNKKISEIVHNPENHFSLNGFKFISLKNIEFLKTKRNEQKDIEDIKQIKSLFSGKSSRPPFRSQIKKIFNPSFIKGRVKFQLLKLRYQLTLLKRRMVKL